MSKADPRCVLPIMPNNISTHDPMSVNAKYIDLGLKEYKEAWDFQEELLKKTLEKRDISSKSPEAGTLIFCEHPHVYTLGKSGQQNNLLIRDDFLKKINASYYQSNRGGDITYHGPGQIVGYPVFDLGILRLGVKDYIYKLESSIISCLRDYEIEAQRMDGATGVWLSPGTKDARKICAIGVRVSRAITMHGFALNVNTDLSYFSHINPCGFTDKGVTSLQKEKGMPVDLEEVRKKLKVYIADIFGISFF